jgi:hypothetical protein
MTLNTDQREEIRRRLQRSNRKIWSSDVLPHVYETIDSLRTGRVHKKDYFIPGMVTYEDYMLHLGLIGFI